jgi:hypothetical protein
MNHALTVGHFDTAAIVRDRKIVVLAPLDMAIANRLLDELGDTDAEGRPTLGDCPVEFHDGSLCCLWWVGGWCNRALEEFVLRLQRETGCLIADREHGRIVEPGQLQGLKGEVAAARGG